MDMLSFITDYLYDQEDGIRQLITWFLNLVMEEEALLQCGAQRHERTDSRVASRNGYKKRNLTHISPPLLIQTAFSDPTEPISPHFVSDRLNNKLTSFL